MASLRVPVYYDFASSLCYVAHVVMGRMTSDLDALGITLDWRPVDLTRLTGWRRGDPIRGVRRANALRVARELDVPLQLSPRWMDARPALAAALSLRGDDEVAFRAAVWAAVYEEGRALDEGGWVLDLALRHGAKREDTAAFERLDLATREAAELEVSGVPSFLLGSWPLGGIQEIPTMRAVLARYVERHRELH